MFFVWLEVANSCFDRPTKWVAAVGDPSVLLELFDCRLVQRVSRETMVLSDPGVMVVKPSCSVNPISGGPGE